MDPFTSSIYRLELDIADKSDEAVLVGFDGEMTKLTNIKASEAELLLVCGTPEDLKTTNDFVPRHEGESKTRGCNRKSRGKKEKPVSYVKLEKL
ncbi:hypothetical protein Bca4012_020468 [Brassica carinata]|uniref:Uncharacterized protein n=1 Tax=Brassica carinata TaxID=52824 RepID=A0A8X7WIL3_BRACI|nr:hypothetical protein Bca52824_001182 [Brassica carinata]